jgi:hypothetical protein
MDVFVLVMGLTLFTAGWFIFWDYVRFLYSSYSVKGRVVSFTSPYLLGGSARRTRRTASGMYPIIEYLWAGQLTRFTSLDHAGAEQLQVGDIVNVCVSRSRRQRSRLGKGSIFLMIMLAALCVVLLSGALLVNIQLNVVHIILASCILALSLSFIVLYLRNQDETHSGLVRRMNPFSVFLSEPSSFCHWSEMTQDRFQRRRILGFRMVGAACFTAGVAMIVAAFFMTDITGLRATIEHKYVEIENSTAGIIIR